MTTSCSVRFSCFNHFDQRIPSQDPKDKGQRQGVVKNQTTGRVYGTITKDSDGGLRKKFALLAIIQTPVMLLGRIPYRIYSLVSGDFVESAVKAAKKEWWLNRQQWSLTSPEKRSVVPPDRYYFIVAIHVIKHLVKNILKIITIPLATIAQQFAALYGLINPLDGRILFTAINELWSRDVVQIHSSHSKTRACMLHISDYLGWCLQPKDVWRNKNLYRVWGDYHPHTIRSLLNTITVELEDKRMFFQNEGINIDFVLSQLEKYMMSVGKISESDGSETDDTGALKKSSGIQEKVRIVLIKLTKSLGEIERGREMIVDLQANSSSSSEVLLSQLTKQDQLIAKIETNLKKLVHYFLHDS